MREARGLNCVFVQPSEPHQSHPDSQPEAQACTESKGWPSLDSTRHGTLARTGTEPQSAWQPQSAWPSLDFTRHDTDVGTGAGVDMDASGCTCSGSSSCSTPASPTHDWPSLDATRHDSFPCESETSIGSFPMWTRSLESQVRGGMIFSTHEAFSQAVHQPADHHGEDGTETSQRSSAPLMPRPPLSGAHRSTRTHSTNPGSHSTPPSIIPRSDDEPTSFLCPGKPCEQDVATVRRARFGP